MKNKGNAILKSALVLTLFFAAQFVGAFVAVFIQAFIDAFNAINTDETLSETVKHTTDSMGNLSVITIAVEMVIVLIFYMKVRKKNPAPRIKEVTIDKVLQFGLVGAVLNFIVTSVLTILSHFFSVTSSTADIIFTNNTYNPIVVLVVIGMMAPIAEEIIFRYGMQGYLSEAFGKYAILIQGVVFGIIHSQFGTDIVVTESGSIDMVKISSISGYINAQVVYAMFLGIILGVIYEKTKDLTSVIVVHAIINSISVLATYSLSSELKVVTEAMVFFMAMVLLLPNVRENLRGKMCLLRKRT